MFCNICNNNFKFRRRTHLLFVNDVDAGLDVREGMGGGEDGLAFELFMQVPVCPPIQSERGAVDKTAQVVVLVEVSDAVLHLICIKVWLHICDLDEGLWIPRESYFRLFKFDDCSFS